MNELEYRSNTAGTPSSCNSVTSSSQLMSSPGVAASRSTSSISDRDSWYAIRLPDKYSASIANTFCGSFGTRRTTVMGAHPLLGSQVVDRIGDVLLQQRLDPSQRLLLRDAGDVIGPGQRHARHRRGLRRQSAEILGLQRVHVGLPARARQHLALQRQRVQEVVDAGGRGVDLEALAQLGVLGGDPDRAAAGVAVVALAGRHADRALVVGDPGDLLVAVQRHQAECPIAIALAPRARHLAT